MLRKAPLISGEFYHIYNRGAHKQPIFLDGRDYNRFLLSLYSSNNTERIPLGNLFQNNAGRSCMDMFDFVKADKALVDVVAYCLMSNHFHLILRQKVENGISIFMKKLLTAHSMYFNIKHDHSGTLFQGRFKSKHVNTDDYFRYLVSYVHLNPLEIIEPDWKENGVRNIASAKKFMDEYQYSSFCDYGLHARAQQVILIDKDSPEFIKTANDIEDLLQWYSKNNAGRSCMLGY